MIPAQVVDALPERLWFVGNMYRVFGRTLNLCVGGDGHRTIELDYTEIGRRRRRLPHFRAPPSDQTAGRLWRLDLGWASFAAFVLVLVSVAVVLDGVVDRRTRSCRGDLMRCQARRRVSGRWKCKWGTRQCFSVREHRRHGLAQLEDQFVTGAGFDPGSGSNVQQTIAGMTWDRTAGRPRRLSRCSRAQLPPASARRQRSLRGVKAASPRSRRTMVRAVPGASLVVMRHARRPD